jgi:hypothetical protein
MFRIAAHFVPNRPSFAQTLSQEKYRHPIRTGGRLARWHETLSQFNMEVQYIPGKKNTVADAISRYAYTASSSREDVSFHSSAKAKAEVKKVIEKDIAK